MKDTCSGADDEYVIDGLSDADDKLYYLEADDGYVLIDR